MTIGISNYHISAPLNIAIIQTAWPVATSAIRYIALIQIALPAEGFDILE